MKARKVSEGSKRRKQGHVRGHVALGILLFGAVSLGTAPAQQPPATAPAAAAPTTARASALAEKPLTLSEVVQLSVLRNPEVLSRFHAIKAAGAERDAIRGGLYPRVDLQGSTGPERQTSKAALPAWVMENSLRGGRASPATASRWPNGWQRKSAMRSSNANFC